MSVENVIRLSWAFAVGTIVGIVLANLLFLAI